MIVQVADAEAVLVGLPATVAAACATASSSAAAAQAAGQQFAAGAHRHAEQIKKIVIMVLII